MYGGTFITSFAGAALAVFVFFLALYVVSLVRKNNTVADIGWGIGFIIAALTILWQRDALNARQIIVTSLVIIWGSRLALHVWLRSRGKGEDWWHKAWRRSWGDHWVIRSFLQIYVLQWIYLLVIATPFIFVNTFGGPPIGVLDFVGLGIWVFGFAFEVVGDYQLSRFKEKRSNKGHVLCSGLWRYSRHPNYFGEVAMWVGLWLIAVSVPGGWATIVSPVLITVLLVWGRGIPLIEEHFSANPDYLAYKKSTSKFIPWFPVP